MRMSRIVVGPLAIAVLAASFITNAPTAEAKSWEPPASQLFPFVDVAAPTQKPSKPKKIRTAQPATPPKWPAAGKAQVKGLRVGGPARPVDGTPVSVSVPAKAKKPASDVQVAVLPQKVSQRLVGTGVVVSVTGAPGSQAKLKLDYSQFVGAGGGGYGARLHWVELPACALETPDSADCQTPTTLASTNTVDEKSVATTFALPEANAGVTSTSVVMAAVAGTASDQGNWSATSLNPSSLWQAGGSAGTFTWSYPMRTPPVAGSLAPSLALSYNSGATDGVVSATNTQTSWVGEGFDLSMGFIERTYVSCPIDKPSAGTAPVTSQDLCWFSDSKVDNNAKWDNATLSLSGHAGVLVRIGNTAQWRLKDDDGTRIEKLGSVASSTSASTEYWKVTTSDGTQYFFGKGKADGSTAAATNSRWSVPVAANQTGEPGYDSSFGSAFRSQPWRWNLDYVVDPTGDTMTVYYNKESNRYLRNGGSQVSYDRGGTISSISYGERKGSEAGTPAAKVTFVVKERCDTTVSGTCETSNPTTTTATAWPDVPTDAICESGGYCPDPKKTPTFFTRKRLSQVNTFVRNTANTGYDPVDTWDLGATFPATNDTTSMPTLWLSTISHTGKAGTGITVPTTTLEPAMMRNRITGPYGTYGLNRPRLSRIWTESGGRISVTYSGEDCTPTSLPSNAATNTTRCFPSYYAPEPTLTPYLTWFTKYVVSEVESYDTTVETIGLPNAAGAELSAAEVTSYSYSGGGAWHWDDSVLSYDDYRTWNQWRGYGKVTTISGAGSTKTVSEDTYFRGMNGDRANTSGTATKSVSVTTSNGATWSDDEVLAGMTRESRSLVALGGAADSRAIYDPWTHATSNADDGRNQATMVDVAKTASTQFLASGSRSSVSEVKARDSWGQPTMVEDTGDTAVTGDERCTRTTYATPSGAATAIDLVAEQTVMPSLCATSASEAAMIAASRHFFDGSTTRGQLTGPGFETRSDQLVGSTTHSWRTVARASYDQHGRAISVTDALNHTASTAFSPSTNRSPSTVTLTSNDPDGSGPSPVQVTTTTLDPRFGSATKNVGPAGQTTEVELDALGRTTAVWNPGQPRTSVPSAKYTYVINQASTGLNGVKTETLVQTNTGPGYRTSWQLLDALLRVRQTQTASASVGSQVTDVRYDSRGNQTLVDSYLISGLPSSSLVAPSSRTAIQRSTRNSYDYANRALASALYSAEVKKWETTSVYDGDRAAVTPPSGGTPTTTVVDIHGRTTELIQHLGTTTSAPASTTHYTYTPAGQLSTMTDPKGNTWHYTYDLQGNRLTATDPDSGTTTTTFNEVNLPVTVTDARGKGTRTSYDGLGRVTATSTLDGGTTLTTTSYDVVGNTMVPGLVASTSRWVEGAEIKTSVDSYDSAGRATSTSLTVPTIPGLIPAALAGTYTTTSSFNADGSPNTIGLPATGPIDAETLTYGYRATGVPNSLSGMASVVRSTAYTQWDTVSSVGMGSVSGNLLAVMYNREESTLRLTRMRTVRQVSGTDEDTGYSFDDAGNVVGVKATLKSGQVDNQCFQYDYQGQLVEAFTVDGGTVCSASTSPVLGGSGPAPYWDSWAIDSIGRTTQRTERSAAGVASTVFSYPADGSSSVRPHSLVQAVTSGVGAGTFSFGYDAAGAVVSRPQAGQQQSLSYDDEGRLSGVEVGGESFFGAVYDAAGSRLVKREPGRTTLSVAGTELSVDEASGAVSASRYYSWQGSTVGVRTGNGASQLWSVVVDHQNSSHHQVRNSDSGLVSSWQDPYGAVRGGSLSGWVGERSFVGGVRDATGLVRVGVRDYDSGLGRFLSVDPVLDVADPVQWNPYVYADNSPVTKSDPSGLRPVDFTAEMWKAHKAARSHGASRARADAAAFRTPSGRAGGNAHVSRRGISSALLRHVGLSSYEDAEANVRAATRWNRLPDPGPLPPTRAEQVGPVGTVVEVLATAAVVLFAPEVVAAVVGNPWAVVTAIADSSAGGSMLAGSAGAAVGSAALRYEANLAAKTATTEIDASKLTMTKTVEQHLTEYAKDGTLARPYGDSRLTIQEIMRSRDPIPDPGGVPGALRWDAPGAVGKSSGTWELVVDPETNTILHFLFRSGQ